MRDALPAAPWRRWIPFAVVVIAAITWLAFTLYSHYVADPSAGEYQRAIQRVAPEACAAGIQVQGIDAIGGPGLPDGMVKAKAIVCRSNGEDDRLAIHYLFSSNAAARDWLDSADDPMYQLGSAAYGWTLINKTLAARVTIASRPWQQVVRQIADSRD